MDTLHPHQVIDLQHPEEHPLNRTYSSAIPASRQLEISFRNLTYSVATPKGEKLVLDAVSGRFRPGALTVILGSSGAGKTSLLNLIVGKINGGTTSGDICINGNVVHGKDVGRIAGFVDQEDVVLDTQTVREAITMSCLLRVPETVSVAEKHERVSNVIEMMHLQKAADTPIGSTMIAGVSGGEKKRTCIAMELVTNPPVLFLDEPTSGLDSYSALTAVRYLKRLARTGRTIVATLHQPSSEIFHLVDDLILMAEGKIMYCGEAKKSLDYFAERGYPCPKYSNPADFFFMSMFHDDDGNDKEANTAHDMATLEKENDKRNLERQETLLREWPDATECRTLHAQLDAGMTSPVAFNKPPVYKASFVTQFKFLFQRAWNNAMRNKMVVKVRVAQVIVFSLLLDLIFNRIPDRDVNAQVQDRVGSLFFVIVNMVLAFAMGNLAIFIVERVVFEREYRAGMYGLPAYFFSKSLVDLPFLFLLPAIYAALTYFCVGYQLEVGKFFNFLATVFLLANVGTGLGLFAAASFPNLTIALMSVPMLVLPFMIFAGLFVNLATLPVWIRWFKWLSPMKYGYVAFVKNEFTGLQIPCPTGSPPGCVIPGETIIERYGMSDQGSIAVNLIALTGFLVLFWSLAFLGLYRTVTFGNASVKQVKADAHAQLLKKTT